MGSGIHMSRPLGGACWNQLGRNGDETRELRGTPGHTVAGQEISSFATTGGDFDNMSKRKTKPRYVKTLVPLSKGEVSVYAGVRVSNALHEVTVDMDFYKGVKLAELLEAVYQQGKKDGARGVRDSFEKMMKQIPHLNPGQPRKRKPTLEAE